MQGLGIHDEDPKLPGATPEGARAGRGAVIATLPEPADAVDGLRKLLIPRALVITPNLPEAAALVGASPARNEKEMEIQARELLALGARNVLIKGGHGASDDRIA